MRDLEYCSDNIKHSFVAHRLFIKHETIIKQVFDLNLNSITESLFFRS